MEKSIENKEERYVYRLEYKHTNCSYEILVNDVPLITFFGLGNRSTAGYINDKIVSPGKQDITIRLYPQKIDDTEFAKGLTKDSKVKIMITKNKRNSDPMWAWRNVEPTRWDILTFETPEIEDGQPYAEFKTSIDLKSEDINWQITGWTNGQDLRNDPTIKQGAMYCFIFQKLILYP